MLPEMIVYPLKPYSNIREVKRSFSSTSAGIKHKMNLFTNKKNLSHGLFTSGYFNIFLICNLICSKKKNAATKSKLLKTERI